MFTTSHEIRNPLTGLKGSVEMVAKKISTTVFLADAHKQLKQIKTDIIRLNTLITEVLNIAKSDALRSEIKITGHQDKEKDIVSQCVALCELVSNTLKSLAPHFSQLTEVEIFLEGMKASVDHLSKLVNPLRDQADQSEKNLRFDPERVIQEVTSMHAAQIQEKGLEFKTNIPKDIPTLAVDVQSFKQVLINLLANAISSTEKGTINIVVEAINQISAETTLRVNVKDTGQGIPQEALKKMGERFFQATNKKEGTGLGLSICKQLIADVLKGQLDIESIPGQGSTFAFTFTAKRYVADTSPPAPVKKRSNSPILKSSYIHLKGGKVLVAEDNSVNQKILQAMLEEIDMICEIAANGEEAVNKCQQFKPDIILMDLNMPKMNGSEAASKIRTLVNTPIIGLSAEAKPDSAAIAHMNTYLTKPYVKKMIYETIGTYVSKQLDNKPSLPSSPSSKVSDASSLSPSTVSPPNSNSELSISTGLQAFGKFKLSEFTPIIGSELASPLPPSPLGFC